MKISKIGNNLYLISNQNHIFHFYASFPAMRISIGESYSNEEGEKIIFKNAFEVDENFHQLIKKYITSEGVGTENNYYEVCNILRDYFNVSQEELDKIFNYNKEAVELCKSLKGAYPEWHYDDCCRYLKQWNGDKERAKKFIEKFHMKMFDNVMVDIFPSKEDLERPTWNSESWLLHEFHNSWGDTLNNIIKKSVEKYPDFNDIDYAAYYVQDRLNEEREKEFKNKYGRKEEARS